MRSRRIRRIPPAIMAPDRPKNIVPGGVCEHAKPDAITTSKKTALERGSSKRFERIADSMYFRNVEMLHRVLESVASRGEMDARGQIRRRNLRVVVRISGGLHFLVLT